MQKEIQQHSKTNQGNNRIEKNKQRVILTNKGIEKQLDEERKVFLKEKEKNLFTLAIWRCIILSSNQKTKTKTNAYDQGSNIFFLIIMSIIDFY